MTATIPRFITHCVNAIVFLCLTSVSSAQIKLDTSPAAERFGPGQTVRYRVGASITATNGPVHDVTAMVAIPFECDEQVVNKVEEDISQEVADVEYRTLQGGATQMLISIPYLAGKQEAHAILTFDVETKVILPPDEDFTEQLIVPTVRMDRSLKRYLANSPYIRIKDPLIRKELRAIFAEKKSDEATAEDTAEKSTEAETEYESDAAESDAAEGDALVESEDDSVDQEEETAPTSSAPAAEPTPWQRVEQIYDHVQQEIEYLEGDDKTAVATLKSGIGDCHDISALFVALCRADKVPARLVWVHEHCYPEFCLADTEGNLHWFPCESAGARAFGEMPIARVIMQKGDNFHVRERPRERLRYASDYLIGTPVPGSGRPTVRYIREQL